MGLTAQCSVIGFFSFFLLLFFSLFFFPFVFCSTLPLIRRYLTLLPFLINLLFTSCTRLLDEETRREAFPLFYKPHDRHFGDGVLHAAVSEMEDDNFSLDPLLFFSAVLAFHSKHPEFFVLEKTMQNLCSCALSVFFNIIYIL